MATSNNTMPEAHAFEPDVSAELELDVRPISAVGDAECLELRKLWRENFGRCGFHDNEDPGCNIATLRRRDGRGGAVAVCLMQNLRVARGPRRSRALPMFWQVFVSAFCVRAKRQGVGTRFMTLIKEWCARSACITDIKLCVGDGDTAALRLYTSQGFIVTRPWNEYGSEMKMRCPIPSNKQRYMASVGLVPRPDRIPTHELPVEQIGAACDANHGTRGLVRTSIVKIDTDDMTAFSRSVLRRAFHSWNDPANAGEVHDFVACLVRTLYPNDAVHMQGVKYGDFLLFECTEKQQSACFVFKDTEVWVYVLYGEAINYKTPTQVNFFRVRMDYGANPHLFDRKYNIDSLRVGDAVEVKWTRGWLRAVVTTLTPRTHLKCRCHRDRDCGARSVPDLDDPERLCAWQSVQVRWTTSTGPETVNISCESMRAGDGRVIRAIDPHWALSFEGRLNAFVSGGCHALPPSKSGQKQTHWSLLSDGRVHAFHAMAGVCRSLEPSE